MFVWTQEQGQTQWTKQTLKADKFGDTVWRVSWSDSGCLLAVACGDNKVNNIIVIRIEFGRFRCGGRIWKGNGSALMKWMRLLFKRQKLGSNV